MTPAQRLHNVSAEIKRAAIALDRFHTYAGLDDAEDRIIRAINELRIARQEIREAAKPIRKAESDRRRQAAKERRPDFTIPESIGAAA